MGTEKYDHTFAMLATVSGFCFRSGSSQETFEFFLNVCAIVLGGIDDFVESRIVLMQFVSTALQLFRCGGRCTELTRC